MEAPLTSAPAEALRPEAAKGDQGNWNGAFRWRPAHRRVQRQPTPPPSTTTEGGSEGDEHDLDCSQPGASTASSSGGSSAGGGGRPGGQELPPRYYVQSFRAGRLAAGAIPPTAIHDLMGPGQRYGPGDSGRGHASVSGSGEAAALEDAESMGSDTSSMEALAVAVGMVSIEGQPDGPPAVVPVLAPVDTEPEETSVGAGGDAEEGEGLDGVATASDPGAPGPQKLDKAELGGGAIYVRMPRLENGKRICFYWNFTGGCANGDKCYFAHVPVDPDRIEPGFVKLKHPPRSTHLHGARPPGRPHPRQGGSSLTPPPGDEHRWANSGSPPSGLRAMMDAAHEHCDGCHAYGALDASVHSTTSSAGVQHQNVPPYGDRGLQHAPSPAPTPPRSQPPPGGEHGYHYMMMHMPPPQAHPLFWAGPGMPYGGPVPPMVPYHHSYPQHQPPGYAPAPAAVEDWGRYSDPFPMPGDMSPPRHPPPSHMDGPPPPFPVHEMYGGPPDYPPPMGYPMDGGLPPPYGSSYPMAMAMAGPRYPPKSAGPGRGGGRGNGGGGHWRRRGGIGNGHGNGHAPPPRKGGGTGAGVYGREEVKGVDHDPVK